MAQKFADALDDITALQEKLHARDALIEHQKLEISALHTQVDSFLAGRKLEKLSDRTG